MLPTITEIKSKLDEISDAVKQAKEFEEEYKQNCSDEWHWNDIIQALQECYPDESLYSNLTAKTYKRLVSNERPQNQETVSEAAQSIFNELVRGEFDETVSVIAGISKELEIEKAKRISLKKQVQKMKKEITEIRAIINELRQGRVLENGCELDAKIIAHQLNNEQNKNKK